MKNIKELKPFIEWTISKKQGGLKMCQRLLQAIEDDNAFEFREELMFGLRQDWASDARCMIELFDPGGLQRWYEIKKLASQSLSEDITALGGGPEDGGFDPELCGFADC